MIARIEYKINYIVLRLRSSALSYSILLGIPW
jgi:hypothetical protein